MQRIVSWAKEYWAREDKWQMSGHHTAWKVFLLVALVEGFVYLQTLFRPLPTPLTGSPLVSLLAINVPVLILVYLDLGQVRYAKHFSLPYFLLSAPTYVLIHALNYMIITCYDLNAFSGGLTPWGAVHYSAVVFLNSSHGVGSFAPVSALAKAFVLLETCTGLAYTLAGVAMAVTRLLRQESDTPRSSRPDASTDPGAQNEHEASITGLVWFHAVTAVCVGAGFALSAFGRWNEWGAWVALVQANAVYCAVLSRIQSSWDKETGFRSK